jgi:hypothetical protein
VVSLLTDLRRSTSTVIWDITLCSPVVHRRFGTYRPRSQRRRVCKASDSSQLLAASLNVGYLLGLFDPAGEGELFTCTVYSLNRKMEAVSSLEMLVNFHRATERYIPKALYVRPLKFIRRGVISQPTVFSIVITVKSNTTYLLLQTGTHWVGRRAALVPFCGTNTKYS